LYYNKEKVDRDEAEILYWQKMLEPLDKNGRMDVDVGYTDILMRIIY